MIIHYDTRNCPFCCQTTLGKWLANSSLPIGEKIITIDRFSGDRRNEFLSAFRKKFKSLILPLLLNIDEKAPRDFSEAVEKRKSYVVLSVLDCFHLKTFLKHQKNII
jgi:hypothetical protein